MLNSAMELASGAPIACLVEIVVRSCCRQYIHDSIIVIKSFMTDVHNLIHLLHLYSHVAITLSMVHNTVYGHAHISLSMVHNTV